MNNVTAFYDYHRREQSVSAAVANCNFNVNSLAALVVSAFACS